MASLDDIERVVRERLIGSPPHSLQKLGTLEKLNYVGTIGRIISMGIIGQIGTVLLTVRIGTLGKVNRMGTLDEVTTLGTLQTVRYVQRLGTVASDIKGKSFIGTPLRNRVRLGAGSEWVGSWQSIGSYEVKTIKFHVGNPGTSGGGSVSLITGMTGTGISGGTGTYFGPVRIGKGTYTTLSFTEAMRFLRPQVRQHGAGPVPEHGGTVSVHLTMRV